MGEHAGVVGGIGTMMSVRQRPWHYESNKDRVRMVEHDVTSGAQALTLAGIDWTVSKVSLADMTVGHPHAEEFAVIVRDDTGAILGVHKQGYTQIQNEALGLMADAIILAADDGAYIDTAGSLYEPGRVVWMLVRLPDSTVKLDSQYEQWLLIATSHDGRMVFSVRFVKVRVVCMNTFGMAMAGTKATWKVRHTTNQADYMAEARAAVGMALASSAKMDETIDRLLHTPLDAGVLLNPKDGLIAQADKPRPTEDGRGQTMWDARFDAIVSAYYAEHNTAIQDTAWGAVNALQEYEQWGKGVRNRSMADAQMARLLDDDWPLTKKALALVTA
jgi:phage/plasmid-like protein (TIGR03299 family)